MSVDLVYTLALFGVVAVLVLAYSLRVLLKGRAQNDRVDKQGASALLSKGAMEGAYWFLQPVADFLVFCKITPNAVSFSSLGFGFLAGTCLAFGHFGFAAIFATLSALLDSLDGIVARMSGLSSDAGEVLDAAVDRYTEFFFLAGLVIYYHEVPLFQGLALLALLGSFMVSYSSAKAEALQVDPPKGAMRRPERAIYLTLGAALSGLTIPFFERDHDSWGAAGYPMLMALALVALLANLSAITRLWDIAKSIRAREACEKKRLAELQANLHSSYSDTHQNTHQRV